MVKNAKSSGRQFWVGLTSILLGLVVIIGWRLEIQVLMTIVPGYESMKINTALFCILSGIVLVLLSLNKNRKQILFLSSFLAVFAFASLLQDILSVNFGMDQLFILDKTAIEKGHMTPGRPSPITSLCFGLLGIVFTIIRSKSLHFRKAAQYISHIITFLSFIAILGYLFKVPTFYKLSFFTSMAIHTSITLFSLSIAVALVNREFGVTALFSGEKIGNVMARNLFKKMLPAILFLGFFQLILLRMNILTVDFGIALFTTCFILIILYALWSTAKLLNRIDDQRKVAREKIIKTNKNLEKTVGERTSYLTKQNKQLEDFSYIISHNLRGPMGNLKSLLNFYKKEEEIEGKDLLMDYFNTTVGNLSGTLDDLLEVVTIRNNSKKEKSIIAFKDVFSKILENFQGQIMETNAIITSDFSKEPELNYSSVYLESIMHNLFSNSLKYRSKDRVPKIHFETRKTGDKIELLASDNGLGMNMKTHGSRLFGLHKTFHKHPDAKGVGLFITKAQVEAMGGGISVQSEVDKGSTFEVIF